MKTYVTGVSEKKSVDPNKELKQGAFRPTPEEWEKIEAGATPKEVWEARGLKEDSLSVHSEDSSEINTTSEFIKDVDSENVSPSYGTSGIDLSQHIRDTVYKDKNIEPYSETFNSNQGTTNPNGCSSVADMGIPYQGVPLTSQPYLMQQMISSLSVKQISEIIKAAIKEGNSLNAKAELENFKAMLKEYYLKEKEKIHIGREFYKYELFINGEGKICRSVTMPGIDKFTGDKISNCLFPKIEIIKPIGRGGTGLIYKFTAQLSRKDVCFYFNEEFLTVDTFSRQLTKAGVKFFVGHGNRKAIINDLLVTLLEQAEITELPANSGWIKINGLWTWIPFGSRTFKEVRYECLGM